MGRVFSVGLEHSRPTLYARHCFCGSPHEDSLRPLRRIYQELKKVFEKGVLLLAAWCTGSLLFPPRFDRRVVHSCTHGFGSREARVLSRRKMSFLEGHDVSNAAEDS